VIADNVGDGHSALGTIRGYAKPHRLFTLQSVLHARPVHDLLITDLLISDYSAPPHPSPITSHLVLKLLTPRGMPSKAILLPVLSLALDAHIFANEAASFSQPTADHPLEVKVVVLAMFEPEGDPSGRPGEFHFWVNGRKMDYVIPLPAAYHDVRTDNRGVVATVTGEGTAKSATSVMALGLDPRFDFSGAYWLVAGIAGIDPDRGTVGSAVWADYVVDGDLAHEIDAREIPGDWPDGFTPLERVRPFELPRPAPIGEVYTLNARLVDWAYQLTKDVHLTDNEKARADRARYFGHPATLEDPKVLVGATLSSSTYWHGKLLNEWARAWVRYWTDHKGQYFTTAMEDTGTMQALTTG
jgi:purine nucleoside permease